MNRTTPYIGFTEAHVSQMESQLGGTIPPIILDQARAIADEMDTLGIDASKYKDGYSFTHEVVTPEGRTTWGVVREGRCNITIVRFVPDKKAAAGEPLSAWELRRQQILDREQTRWQVVVYDCRDQFECNDGTPCMDTYTKASFPSVQAAIDWKDRHPCGKCCRIIDAHVDLPWNGGLIEQSEKNMAVELERMKRADQQLANKYQCDSCRASPAWRRPHMPSSSRENMVTLCDVCASLAIAKEPRGYSNRLFAHPNMAGFEPGKVPQEVLEYRMSREEWEAFNNGAKVLEDL